MKIVASLRLKAKILLSVTLVVILSGILICARIVFRDPAIDASGPIKDKPTVIIDAGHGGIDGGTQAADGTLEKEINLAIGLKVNDYLISMGYDTVLIRDTDTSIHDESAVTIREKKVSDLKNRLKIIETTDNAILLSIHQNYFTQSKYSGAQVFYSGNNPESETLARTIQTNIADYIQTDNTREIKKSGSEIYLLNRATVPAVMVECGFLSNPDEARMLKDENYQQEMAFIIAISISDYIKTAEE